MRKVCREGCRLLRLGSLAQIFLRWINFRLERDGGAPMRDLTDLFRTENLVRITELVLGRAVDDANYKPRMEENHARNVDLCVSALGAKTKLEWGAAKVRSGLRRTQLRSHTSRHSSAAHQGRPGQAAWLPGDSLLASS